MAPAVISRAEAKAKGLKRYCTGKSCRHGHIAERFVINCACTVCTLANTGEWSLGNGDIKRRLSREWHEKHPDYASRWRQNNPDALRKIARKWYQANSKRAVQISTNWAKNNREKIRTRNRNRKARRIGAPGSHTVEQILEILEFQDWKCAGHHCSRSIRTDRHIDHILPLLLGGSNYVWNLQGLCPTCNCRKNGKHPIVWAAENGVIY
jgi:HNH endonuclease